MPLPWTFPAIDTPRLRMDALTPADLGALHTIQSDPEVCRYMLYEPRTREQVRALIQQMAPKTTLAVDGDDLQPAIRTRDGQLIGTLYVKLVSAADRHAEIGWALAASAQGAGYGGEAASALLDALFDDAGMHRVRAELDPRNEASARLCARLGMRREALFREDLWFKGAWGDTAVYAVLAAEWRSRRDAADATAAAPPGIA